MFCSGSTELHGTIPRELAALTRLQFLLLHMSDVSGTLDPSFSAWSDMYELTTFNTAVSVCERCNGCLRGHAVGVQGTLSPSFSNWTNIHYMLPFRSFLSGTMDAAFASWTQIVQFAVSTSQVSGTMPDVFSAWTALSRIGAWPPHARCRSRV
jgi:hypothetical protein